MTKVYVYMIVVFPRGVRTTASSARTPTYLADIKLRVHLHTVIPIFRFARVYIAKVIM